MAGEKWYLIDFISEKLDEIENFLGKKVNINIDISDKEGNRILNGFHNG